MRLKPIVIAIALGALYSGFTVFLVTGSTTQIAIPFETPFTDQAQTVLRGNTPLFFHAGNGVWLQPAGVYANAAVRAVGVPRGSAGRIASALVGGIDVALVVLIACAIAGTTWAAVGAAITIIFTLSHLGLSMLGTDAIFPAALVLLWLNSVLGFLKFDSPAALNISALAAGACVYAHPSGPLTAVFLWLLTLGVASRRHRARLLIATAIFGVMWAPAAAWFYLHPDTYPDTFGRWFVLKAHLRNPLQGLTAFFNANTLGQRASFYWGFWDPSWLFFSSADASAPLPLLSAPFIILALLRARWFPRNAMIALIGAALIVPLAGSTFGVPHYIRDASPVLPLMAIISGLGFDQLAALITRRKPLEDDETMAPVNGWHDDDALPET